MMSMSSKASPCLRRTARTPLDHPQEGFRYALIVIREDRRRLTSGQARRRDLPDQASSSVFLAGQARQRRPAPALFGPGGAHSCELENGEAGADVLWVGGSPPQ